MKALGKRVIQWLVENEVGWRLIDKTIIPMARHAQWERERVVREVDGATLDLDALINTISPDLVVLNGPFAGLKYPYKKSAGSALFPKILGSYERELHPVFEQLMGEKYTDIVDIGCAEGYYAIGLAMRFPDARVFAFDTDAEARDSSTRMAEVNGVEDRVIIEETCDLEALRAFGASQRALIICDCEGCEKGLFTKEVARDITAHDVLVEAHDFLDIDISGHLVDVFSSTHDVEVIQSIDDIQKVHLYEYREISGYERAVRRKMLAEYRPSIMQWYLMRSRRR